MRHLYQLLLCCYMFVCCVEGEYRNSILNPFPAPLYSKGNRTAVIIAGQLRSANITFLSGQIYASGKSLRSFIGEDDPPTPIRTQLEHIIQVFAKFGGVDLFIYIPCDHDVNSLTLWDGDPWTYRPYPGDVRGCELYSDNPIFAKHTGNRVYCLTEYQQLLVDKFIANHRMWLTYAFGPSGRETFLQQPYGIYRANEAAKENALRNEESYRFKIRLRPDAGVIKPMESPDSYKLVNSNNPCKNSTIYYPSEWIFGVGAEDFFNFGESSDMDVLFDRYIELITKPFKFYQYVRSPTVQWNSESHLRGYLSDKRGICLISHPDIWMFKMRRSDYYRKSDSGRIKEEWTLMEAPHQNS